MHETGCAGNHPLRIEEHEEKAAQERDGLWWWGGEDVVIDTLDISAGGTLPPFLFFSSRLRSSPPSVVAHLPVHAGLTLFVSPPSTTRLAHSIRCFVLGDSSGSCSASVACWRLRSGDLFVGGRVDAVGSPLDFLVPFF